MFGLHPILSVSLVCYKSFKNNFNLDWLSFNWNSRLAFTRNQKTNLTYTAPTSLHCTWIKEEAKTAPQT